MATAIEDQSAAPRPEVIAPLAEQVRPLIAALVLLTALTGIAFPLALWALAGGLFPHRADGSLIECNGRVVGSEQIGQRFTGPAYFHPRTSAAGDGYDAANSGASNLGPTNPKRQRDAEALADAYRRDNGLSPDEPVPADAVTRSGSGLDPHISPANATRQLPRVARVRGLAEEVVRRLVAQQTRRFPGPPRVHVLRLNLALDRLSARR